MEVYELLYKEFKIIILKKFKEMQKNTDNYTESQENVNLIKMRNNKKEPKRNPGAEKYNDRNKI